MAIFNYLDKIFQKPLISGGWIKFVASVLLSAAIVNILLVFERVISAIWQWYKFYGYETEGAITLSMKTAWLYLALSGLLILACFFIGALSKAKGVLIGLRFSNWALAMSFFSVVIYLLLAFSPLNQWRP
ncbi:MULTISPECIES: hypothetical protein [unclassified Microbulbifer]|uniref:hypothetical protein n=1 Tax=unclassified Microbulbifer TaxID=2619833 RepID=UPI0027E58BB2|nr:MULTISPECIES: hypothetical protein [unclassified Microbulbifer]